MVIAVEKYNVKGKEYIARVPLLATINSKHPVFEILNEIFKEVFSVRGFERKKAEQLAEKAEKYNIKFGTVALRTPRYKSGDVVCHWKVGEIRVYGGNRCVKGRDGHYYYIYDYLAIPFEK